MAVRPHSSTSNFRTALWASDEPNNTPSGTMTAARPPGLSIWMMRSTKSNSVLVVERRDCSQMSPLSMLPLKGGLASTMSYLLNSLNDFDMVSLYWNRGLVSPCCMRFITPIRTMVVSKSNPKKEWFRSTSQCWSLVILSPRVPWVKPKRSVVDIEERCCQPAPADRLPRRKPAVPPAGSQTVSPSCGLSMVAIIWMMCRGVRN